MNKIKNFRINLREKEILRLLKKTSKIEVTSQVQSAVQTHSEQLQKIIAPASIYSTFQKGKLPLKLAFSAPDKWIAATVFAVTIGVAFENEIEVAQNKNESVLFGITHCIGVEALEQSVNFIGRLINDEAKDEECELSQKIIIADTSDIEVLCQVLPIAKIGVSFSQNSGVVPMFSSFGLYFWTPNKKRKK